MLFEVPEFTCQKVLFTAIGITILWGKLGRRKLRPYALGNLVDLLPWSSNVRQLIEFCLFVSIGTVVAVGVVDPGKVTQALAAGFGWTGFFAGERVETD